MRLLVISPAGKQDFKCSTILVVQTGESWCSNWANRKPLYLHRFLYHSHIGAVPYRVRSRSNNSIFSTILRAAEKLPAVSAS